MQNTTDDNPYRIQPATEADVRWAAALGQRVYQGFDVIPEATMLEWFGANPGGFLTFWHREERIGNFDVLPLRPAVMQRFVEGDLLERDIRAEDLIPPSESHAIRDLHWESIVVDPGFTGPRSPLTQLFQRSFLQVLAHLCPVQQLGNIYAIAASDAGARLMQRMGLSPVAHASERLDAHPLYRGTVASYRRAQSHLVPSPR